MDVRLYVDEVERQLMTAAEAAGEEARTLAERLVGPLGSAIRLAVQDAVTVAAEEITRELAPGSVEVRLRGRDLDFAVTPPAGASDDEEVDAQPAPSLDDDGAMARVNLRLPDQLKARVEQAAARDGLSVNSWLVRAAAIAVERAEPGRRRAGRGLPGTRYTGWAR